MAHRKARTVLVTLLLAGAVGLLPVSARRADAAKPSAAERCHRVGAARLTEVYETLLAARSAPADLRSVIQLSSTLPAGFLGDLAFGRIYEAFGSKRGIPLELTLEPAERPAFEGERVRYFDPRSGVVVFSLHQPLDAGVAAFEFAEPLLCDHGDWRVPLLAICDMAKYFGDRCERSIRALARRALPRRLRGALPVSTLAPTVPTTAPEPTAPPPTSDGVCSREHQPCIVPGRDPLDPDCICAG